MKRFLSVSMVWVLGVACSATPTVIPTRNLERPTDMTFVCLGVNGDVLSGQRMTACHQRNATDPSVNLNGQRVLGTFAFITNPGRDEIAVADMDRGRLLDLSPMAPGYGMLPTGKNPLVITSSQDGRWVVTANHNSCDFTMVDPVRLLAGTFPSATATAAQAEAVSARIAVQTLHHGPLAASTGELAFLPATAAAPARAVATFPGCDLVALVDFSFEQASATIVDSYYVRADGIVAAGTDPICPAECAVDAVDAGGTSDAELVEAGTDAVDGGSAAAAVDAGTNAAPSYLRALALVPEGTRVYVAGVNGDAISSFGISATGLVPSGRLTLAESAGGVRRLRLGVDPYGTNGDTQGAFLDKRGRFLYAFANDDSIRVVRIGGTADATYAQPPVECDVNLLLPTSDVQPCHPVGEGAYPRRPLVRGPGLRAPLEVNRNSNNPPPVPRDIAFAALVASDSDTNYQSLRGQFGFLLAANGQVYVVNIAPDQPANGSAADGTIAPSMATHSFRELRDVGKSGSTALALSVVPQRLVVTSDQAFATTASYSAQDGPLIQPFVTKNASSTGTSLDTTTSFFSFPDPNALVSRSWNVTWEGSLPEATRETGLVRGGNTHLAGGLDDSGADFCGSGVQPGDVLMFTGCTQNSDCQPDDKFTCRATVSGGRSMCLPIDSTANMRIVDSPSCSRFLKSRMRYEIAQATSTSLQLRLKLDEVPKTSLNPCQTNEDCRPDVDHGHGVAADAKLIVDANGSTAKAFECRSVGSAGPRCVQRCRLAGAELGKDGKPTPVRDEDCRAGRVCEPSADDPKVGLCVEAPPIDPSCFPQPMAAYSVGAGRAFTVAGSSVPNVSSLKRAVSGACVAQPVPDPTLVARIPLSAPQCPASFLTPATSAGTAFAQQLSAQAGSNPCLYQGDYRDGSSASSERTPIHAFFQNPQIRFVLSNLDQYPGDLLSIHFELLYGYQPLVVQSNYEVLLTMGTRILTGPTQTPESPIRSNPGTPISYPYFYVVDQGQTALASGSHGQVLRINPRSGGNQVANFDTTLSGSTPFQIQ